MTAVTLTMTVLHMAANLTRVLTMPEAARETFSWSLNSSLHPALWPLLGLLPTLPLQFFLIKMAPATGWLRYGYLLAAILLPYGWCSVVCFVLLGKLAHFPVTALWSSLVVAACLVRNSASTATTALQQQQRAATALHDELKVAQLQLLRAQIEPHFLFNTLATVRALAHHDQAAAAAMIDNLMRYLSEALPKLQRDESSLSEELQLIDAYLRIHQIRMGSRLSYELRVPEQMGAELIPTMLLLTLVENSLKHGINPMIEGGRISISASRGPAALVLKVADTGQGMTATEGHGMGLANIRRRLTLLYGDSAGLTVARPETRGFVATVSIPRPETVAPVVASPLAQAS